MTDNNVPAGAVSAVVSADGKHVHLKLASLLTRRIYAIKAKGVTSAAGRAGGAAFREKVHVR